MATTKTRDPTRRTNRGSTQNASPVPTTLTKATSARILSEDRTTRRRKFTIFWPGREHETKVIPAPEILKYVTMGHFRAFRVGVEAAKSQRRMAENLEEANQREAEKAKMTAREKVKEFLAAKEAVAGEGMDVESSSDSDIQCDLKPKGQIKKTTTRVIDRRQGQGPGSKSEHKKSRLKKKKTPTAAWLKKKESDSGNSSLNALTLQEQSPLANKTTRLSLKSKATSLRVDSTGRTESRPLKKEQLDDPAHINPAEDTKPGKEED
jgi:hypothetical protein